MTVQGSTFDVRVLDNRAEALRINTEYAPRFGPIKERARVAMAQVSGCTVSSVTGDQAMAFGTLRCSKAVKQSRAKTEVVATLDCVPVRGSQVKGINQVTVELDCEPG